MAYGTVQDLKVWQKGMDLVVEVYRITSQFPSDEKFGLTSQMRRAAVSIPSNIAEGHGRQSGKEFTRFLWIANGSITELETQLIIAKRLNILAGDNETQLRNQLTQIGRMLTSLRNSIN